MTPLTPFITFNSILERGRKVLEYIRRVWRRPVTLHTVDQSGAALALSAT